MTMSSISRRALIGGAFGLAAAGLAGCQRPGRSEASGGASGGGGRELKFAYEGPKGTAQEIAANVFGEGLEEASDGALTIAQYPGAQLGGEPELLQKIRTGDIDFIISSTANAAQIAPPSGVLSVHYLFGSSDDVISAIGDDAVNQAYLDMAAKTVTGATPLTLFTLPLRNFYADFEVHSIDDIKGRKIRVQATKTEDQVFSAYGAQPVHMAFTELYTALQTGVVDLAENALTYYGLNKHYEVAPIMSFSEHEGNCQVIWVAEKAWEGMSKDEQDAVTQAAMKVRTEQPKKAFELQSELKKKYGDMGVKFVEDVDKKGFQDISVPLQDQVAQGLGEEAVKILDAVRKATA
jgi:tripartite ATP-independent transporter DctP family solute receptor